MKYLTLIAIVGLALTGGSRSTAAGALEDKYWADLDAWAAKTRRIAASGMPAKHVQLLAETCGKLVMARAGLIEKARLSTTGREDFRYFVDVCVKLTAQRITPQQEFQNPKIQKMICVNTRHELFKDLCRRAGLIR